MVLEILIYFGIGVVSISAFVSISYLFGFIIDKIFDIDSGILRILMGMLFLAVIVSVIFVGYLIFNTIKFGNPMGVILK